MVSRLRHSKMMFKLADFTDTTTAHFVTGKQLNVFLDTLRSHKLFLSSEVDACHVRASTLVQSYLQPLMDHLRSVPRGKLATFSVRFVEDWSNPDIVTFLDVLTQRDDLKSLGFSFVGATSETILLPGVVKFLRVVPGLQSLDLAGEIHLAPKDDMTRGKRFCYCAWFLLWFV